MPEGPKPDDESIEDQVARSLDVVFGAIPEPVVEQPAKAAPDLLEVSELLRTNAIFGGGIDAGD